MLEESVIQRTLATALRTGGDFAEVFVEDKRSSAAMLDDGRVEELSSGRDPRRRHPGRRGRDDWLRTHRRPDRRRPARRRRGCRRGGPVRERWRPRGWRSRCQSAVRRNKVAVLPETVAKGTKVELLRRADEAARAEGGSIRQVRARYGDSRRRILVANSDGLLSEDDQL